MLLPQSFLAELVSVVQEKFSGTVQREPDLNIINSIVTELHGEARLKVFLSYLNT